MADQELNLLQLTAAIMGTASRKSAGGRAVQYAQSPAFSQQVLTTYHTTFWERPRPHTFPSLATARKIFPSLTAPHRVLAARFTWTVQKLFTPFPKE